MRRLHLFLVLALATASSAAAQDIATSTNAESSDRLATGDVVHNRQAAAQAYDRAASHYVANEFAEAGRWFMSAYRLAPSLAALVQAVRSYRSAGDLTRAGTLALLLREAYPSDPTATEVATSVIAAATPSALLLDVRCEDCVIEVDGRLLATRRAYLSPDTPHVVVAYFGDVRVERSAEGARGAQLVLEIPSPARATPTRPSDMREPDPTDDTTPTLEEGAAPDRGVRVLPPAVLWTGVALTAAVGGLAIWSGVDTLSSADAYDENPTEEGYLDGERLERRTNAFIGATAGLAVLTVVAAILTDFGADAAAEETASVAFSASPDGATLQVRGSW